MKGLCVFGSLFIVSFDGCCCAHATNNDQSAFPWWVDLKRKTHWAELCSI
jgi:hypothetical protein